MAVARPIPELAPVTTAMSGIGEPYFEAAMRFGSRPDGAYRPHHREQPRRRGLRGCDASSMLNRPPRRTPRLRRGHPPLFAQARILTNPSTWLSSARKG